MNAARLEHNLRSNRSFFGTIFVPLRRFGSDATIGPFQLRCHTSKYQPAVYQPPAAIYSKHSIKQNKNLQIGMPS